MLAAGLPGYVYRVDRGICWKGDGFQKPSTKEKSLNQIGALVIVSGAFLN